MIVNNVQLLGRLGSDVAVRTFEDGSSVGNFSLATDQSYKDKEGNKIEKTEWHKIVVKNGLADVISKYAKKGDQIYIQGRLATRKWQDTNGQENWTTEVIVESFRFLNSKKDD